MSAYADVVIVIVSSEKHTDLIGTTLREYEAATGARINAEKLVGWELDTWWSRSMPYNSVVRCWTDGLLKLLGIWFGPDL